MDLGRQRDDDKLDEALEQTFPASDPLANTVETGIRIGNPPLSSRPSVSDNPALKRFELTIDGHTAFLAYDRTDDTLTLKHTEVPDALRGRHLGEALVRFALDVGRFEGLLIVVVCPFARAHLREHRSSG
jgi:predicted GNAT family acetyltransferase